MNFACRLPIEKIDKRQTQIGNTMTVSSTNSIDGNQLEQVRRLAEAETGMDFSGTRLARLGGAVSKVLSRETTQTIPAMLSARPEERGQFVEKLSAELTIGETFFFRNEHHFRALREQVIPAILRDNVQQREIRVWSAGCASGEEPYSVAILLDQMLGGATGWRFSILGTDLNPQFLDRAREATYRAWSFRQTNVQTDSRYFTADGDVFRLAPSMRSCVRFAYLNLVKDVYPSPLTGTLGLDLILFRNVAIYLKPEVTRAILARFQRALRPGGWLLLGETEVNLAPVDGFEPRRFNQATFYQKSAAGADFDVSYATSPPLPILAPLAEYPPASPAPPLPELTLPVPSVPEWVPLPWTKARDESPPKPAADAPSATANKDAARRAETSREESNWAAVERSLAAGNVAEAERVVQRIANRHERAPVRLKLTQALLARGELDRARQMLELCLKEEPLLIGAQLLRASFAEEAGDFAAAEAAYRKALYLDRNCAMTHFHLALVQQQQGNPADAERSLKTTLKLSAGKDPHELVEYGEGVCYGRLCEMANVLIAD